MMLQDATHASTCVYFTTYHIVWCTKYRKQIFNTEELRHEVENLLEEIAREYKMTIIKQKVMPDHVHILISFHPKNAPADMIRILKGKASKLIGERHPDIKQQNSKGIWSPGYYLGTLGNMSQKTVDDYIERQY